MNGIEQRSGIGKEKGFTLIEVMIVVAIIAILAAIAFPSYHRHVLRSHRTEARNALQEAAAKIDQHYSVSRSYDTMGDGTKISDATLATWGLDKTPLTGTVRYNISFASIGESGYVLQAVATGPQVGDECGAFFLTQSGAKMATKKGAAANVPNTTRDAISRECWTR